MKQFKIERSIEGLYQCVDENGKVYGKTNPQRCLAFLDAVEYLKENITEEWELKY